MNIKKRNIIITIIIVIIFQTLLYLNNTHKSSFRYFIWNIEEITIGNFISISFVSGLAFSFILNNSLTSNSINNYTKEEDGNDNFYEELVNEEENIFNGEIPPQRDLRDSQPTISVNYRVIKDSLNNNLNDQENISPNSNYQDDWANNDNEW